MPGLRGLYSSLESVSLVECTSLNREVGLVALGGAELDGAECVFERLSRLQRAGHQSERSVS